MKKAKINPLKTNQNDKILLDEQEFSDSERIEYICSSCHCGPLVTISDKTGNSDLFCRRCGNTYDLKDDTVRHRHWLTVPEETEPAVSIIYYDLDKGVEIRHQPTLKDGAAQLAKKGTIRFTYYYDSSKS